ncbi:MAG: ABC transporter ATP-binding protein [Steroidobacteraceae bacterium]
METIRAIYALLDESQKRRSAILLLVFSASAMLQVVGVASIAPFVALLDNTALIHTNRWLKAAYDIGHFHSDKQFLVWFAIAVMLLTVVSNAVGALTTRTSVRTSFAMGAEFQKDMFRGYLCQDYAVLARTNTATLMSALSQEAARFVYMVLTPLLNLISYSLTALTIVALLVAIDPVAALIVSAIIGVIYSATYRLSTERLSFHGRRVSEINEQRFRLMSESLGGLKEVKLLGTEAHYQSMFERLNSEGQRSNAAVVLLTDLPRFFLEAAAFCALLGLAIHMLIKGADTDSIVAVLSLYAMAGYRLLPVAQNILRSASSIKANASVIEILAPHIKAGRAAPANDETDVAEGRFPAGPIALEDVSYSYPETATPALRNVSISIPPRAITVLVGESGAGKSTLADILLGLLRPSHGAMTVGGALIDRTNVRRWQRNLGYVPQNIYILDATIADNIAMGSPTARSMDRVKRAAGLASLDRFIESLPRQYEQVTGERGGMLSGGQRQRIGIARALYHDAEVLIMDEATSALDAFTENEILESLRSLRGEKTIVMVAHRLSTIQAADWIVMLKNGSVAAQGHFRELAENNDDFRAMLAAATHTAHSNE